MAGIAKLIGRILGIWLGLAFASTLPISVWAFNLNRTAYQADTYLEAFGEQDVYENITPLILPVIAENRSDALSAERLQFNNVMANLEQDDWTAIADEVIPEGYLREVAETNLVVFFDYINGDQARLDMRFDMADLRENLIGQPGTRMVNRIVTSWETCNTGQETQLAAFLDGEDVPFPYCNPNNATLQRGVFTELNNTKDQLAQEIPNDWVFREQYAERNNLTLREADIQFYENVQRPNVILKGLYPLAFLIPSAFLALIMMVTVDSGKSFFGWMSWPLILAGVFILLPLFIVPIILTDLTFQGETEADISDIQAETLRGMTLSLVNSFSMPIFIQGSLIVALGFLAAFISILLPGQKQNLAYENASPYPNMPVYPTSGSSASRPNYDPSQSQGFYTTLPPNQPSQPTYPTLVDQDATLPPDVLADGSKPNPAASSGNKDDNNATIVPDASSNDQSPPPNQV